MNDPLVDQLIEHAIREDVGDGDHTSLAIIPETEKGKAQLIVKDQGILAGVAVAEKIFKKFEPSIVFNQLINDGTPVKYGDIAFTVEGKVLTILQCERLVLNIMQRMSGVATQTKIYVDKLQGQKTKVLDTRKTTPGMRLLDKWAVKLGGGENHRIGLFDMILIKDNHIDFAGGIENAINSVKEYLERKGKKLDIEVEARSIDDIRRIMAMGGIRRIMLDNFNLEKTREAVKLINGQYETESSGGITLDSLRSYAECGVDYISVGALTHQIKSLDLSLKAVK
ncbi:MAG TPA: carboxylating nicotinate-nucleotide diphosphorylase [Bacteroidales bacterium]|nr:carboxylating nicotinate-nucleotide diphosphorylase [Bacteroidales bacterium]